MKKVIKIIGNSIINILVIIAVVILIFSIYFLVQTKILNKDYANIFGYTFFEIATGSMSGTLEIGDVVIVKLTNDVEIGDIIVYKEEDYFITHRLIEKNQDTLIAKGDANNSEDSPISINDVIGKVEFTIKNVGIWKKVFTSPSVLITLFITIVLFGIVLIYKPKEKVEEKGGK